ncbi:hypothetical protein G6F22_018159 [Rhizopus arrhizus]|nr:hypothetical protein G6F22_018159 [Rhizopus arrhizus]
MADLLEHAGARLAAGAVVIRTVRAQEHGIDAAADCGQLAPHLGVDGGQRVHVEQAARQAGLVGGDHHLPIRLRQSGDRLQAARQGDPFVGILDERIAVLIDDAVAVEDDQFHCASLEMSATWFIRPCSWLKRASRLARTAGSSAMTMTSAKNASTGSRAWASVDRLPAKSPAATRRR